MCNPPSGFSSTDLKVTTVSTNPSKALYPENKAKVETYKPNNRVRWGGTHIKYMITSYKKVEGGDERKDVGGAGAEGLAR